MADPTTPVEQVVEQLQEVAKELDQIKSEAAPAPAEAPAAEIPPAPESPKAPESPEPAAAEAEAEFEDRPDSVGNTFRVWKDGRPTELLPRPGVAR